MAWFHMFPYDPAGIIQRTMPASLHQVWMQSVQLEREQGGIGGTLAIKQPEWLEHRDCTLW